MTLNDTIQAGVEQAYWGIGPSGYGEKKTRKDEFFVFL
jgi:hypothetical protein